MNITTECARNTRGRFSCGTQEHKGTVLLCYELAFKDFSNAVLESYKSADRNHGDYNLYHLDTEDIVNKAFASVFGRLQSPPINL